MINLKNILRFLVVSFVTFHVFILIMFSQQLPQYSLVQLNPLLINPAYTGVKFMHNFSINSRFQWLGFKGAPITQNIAYHGPIKKTNFAIGMIIENDITGARISQNFTANFAYSVQVNSKYHRLSFGLCLSGNYSRTDFSSLDVNQEDHADPLRVNSFLFSPNVGMGMYYLADNFFAGFSIPRFLSNTNGLLSHPQFKVFDPVFCMNGGYIFELNSNWKLKINSLLRLQIHTPVQVGAGLTFCWLDKLNIGVAYRMHESIVSSIVYRVSPKFYFGYAFDFPINGLVLNQWGSHEFNLSFEWGRSLKKRKASSCFEF